MLKILATNKKTKEKERTLIKEEPPNQRVIKYSQTNKPGPGSMQTAYNPKEKEMENGNG